MEARERKSGGGEGGGREGLYYCKEIMAAGPATRPVSCTFSKRNALFQHHLRPPAPPYDYGGSPRTKNIKGGCSLSARRQNSVCVCVCLSVCVCVCVCVHLKAEPAPARS